MEDEWEEQDLAYLRLNSKSLALFKCERRMGWIPIETIFPLFLGCKSMNIIGYDRGNCNELVQLKCWQVLIGSFLEKSPQGIYNITKLAM